MAWPGSQTRATSEKAPSSATCSRCWRYAAGSPTRWSGAEQLRVTERRPQGGGDGVDRGPARGGAADRAVEVGDERGEPAGGQGGGRAGHGVFLPVSAGRVPRRGAGDPAERGVDRGGEVGQGERAGRVGAPGDVAVRPHQHRRAVGQGVGAGRGSRRVGERRRPSCTAATGRPWPASSSAARRQPSPSGPVTSDQPVAVQVEHGEASPVALHPGVRRPRSGHGAREGGLLGRRGVAARHRVDHAEVVGQVLGLAAVGGLQRAEGVAQPDRVPLGLVAVEQRLVGPAAHHPAELPAEVVRRRRCRCSSRSPRAASSGGRRRRRGRPARPASARRRRRRRSSGRRRSPRARGRACRRRPGSRPGGPRRWARPARRAPPTTSRS